MRASRPAESLLGAAEAVLRDNDRGTHTVAAPRLYPHQWSWDAALISVGWATISVPRALVELRSLLAGQWRNGMVPQILFSEENGYFPGPERWRTHRAVDAPSFVQTSGICQPPVHGIAIHIIGELARSRGGAEEAAFDAFALETFDGWLAWHRWLGQVRSTDMTGLVEIHHGWESGMDNSPRWDEPYARVQVGDIEPYLRQDLDHVADAAERPTDAEYDRYIWLVDQLATVRYNDDEARQTVDFRVGDVFVTAIHALSATLLARLAERIGRPADAEELMGLADRARGAVLAAVDPSTGLARDRDLRTRTWISTLTIGGFAPLVAGADDATYDGLVEELLGPRWCGHPSLYAPLPPTTSPDSPAFRPASYWRGPTWPIITWLLSWCLEHHGRGAAADRLRDAGIEQLSDLTFGEYYHALDGRPLGSGQQSWTAAAALAWGARVPAVP